MSCHFSVEQPVDVLAPVLDTHAHRYGLGDDLGAACDQHPVGIARAVPRRQHHDPGGDIPARRVAVQLPSGWRVKPSMRQRKSVSPPAARISSSIRVTTPRSTSVPTCGFALSDILRRSQRTEGLQYECAPGIIDPGQQLAVRKGSRAARAELNIDSVSSSPSCVKRATAAVRSGMASPRSMSSGAYPCRASRRAQNSPLPVPSPLPGDVRQGQLAPPQFQPSGRIGFGTQPRQLFRQKSRVRRLPHGTARSRPVDILLGGARPPTFYKAENEANGHRCRSASFSPPRGQDIRPAYRPEPKSPQARLPCM